MTPRELHDLGEDAQRDLLRRPGADVEPGGVADAVQRLGRDTAPEQALAQRNLRGLPLSPAADDWSSLTTPTILVTDNAKTLPATLPPKKRMKEDG